MNKNIKNLEYKRPNLFLEIHPTKNVNLDTNNLKISSKDKIWWRCHECNHDWEAVVARRCFKNGSGCPVCSRKRGNKKKSKSMSMCKFGVNDLKSQRPDLFLQIHPTKNTNINIETLTVKSNKKIWWLCSNCGNEWENHVYNVSNGFSCSKCNIEKLIKKGNSLKEKRPILFSEIHPTKNKGLNLECITYMSNKRLWWLCTKCKHEWSSTVYNRSNGHGCPRCVSRVSLPEKIVFYYILKYFNDAIPNYKLNSKNLELDVYIPSLRIGIEYDGLYHLENRDRDIRKNNYCKENNIFLIRIREKGNTKLDDYSLDYILSERLRNTNFSCLDDIIKQILIENLNVSDIDVCSDRDLDLIYKIMELGKKENSLKKINPEVAKSFHYFKNNGISTEHLTHKSAKKVWWYCEKCNYDWISSVANRTAGHGCPSCAGSILKKNVNDLVSLLPNIAKEFNSVKNCDIVLENLTHKSAKKVWWKCSKCNYEWLSSVVVRCKNNGTCPCCSGKVYVKGVNDLMTLRPDLVKQINPDRNKNIRLDRLTLNIKTRIWWKCDKCGKKWRDTVYNRVKNSISPCMCNIEGV